MKMFFTLEETKAKLGLGEDEIKQLCREGRLREFRDGPRLMFKADQVDTLSVELEPLGKVKFDLLAPEPLRESKQKVGSRIGEDVFGDAPRRPRQEPDLIRLFDDEGVMDLPRESDDTDLGPDLLNEIVKPTPPVKACASPPRATQLRSTQSNQSTLEREFVKLSKLLVFAWFLVGICIGGGVGFALGVLLS